MPEAMWARRYHQQLLYEVYSTLRDSHWGKDVLKVVFSPVFIFSWKYFSTTA